MILPAHDVSKLQTHAAWLKSEHADAAASLLEGLEEMFAVNELGLTPALIRCLATTNIVENPNGTASRDHAPCQGPMRVIALINRARERVHGAVDLGEQRHIGARIAPREGVLGRAVALGQRPCRTAMSPPAA